MRLTGRPAVHIFALSMDEAAASDLGEPGNLAAALGAEVPRPDRTEVIAVRDIAALGLPAYLREGFDVEPDALSKHRARLDALGGHVLLVRGTALPPGGADLTLDPRLTHIATLPELGPAPPPMTPLRAESAKGSLPGGAVGDGPHQASRRTLLIGVVAALVLGIIVILVARFT